MECRGISFLLSSAITHLKFSTKIFCRLGLVFCIVIKIALGVTLHCRMAELNLLSFQLPDEVYQGRQQMIGQMIGLLLGHHYSAE